MAASQGCCVITSAEPRPSWAACLALKHSINNGTQLASIKHLPVFFNTRIKVLFITRQQLGELGTRREVRQEEAYMGPGRAGPADPARGWRAGVHTLAPWGGLWHSATHLRQEARGWTPPLLPPASCTAAPWPLGLGSRWGGNREGPRVIYQELAGEQPASILTQERDSTFPCGLR